MADLYFSEFSHIFFDFDGTLCASEQDIAFAWHNVIEGMGLSAPDFDRIFRVGPSLPDMTEELFPELPKSKRDEIVRFFKKIYDDSDFPHTRPYPWITAYLESLKSSGHKLFILTNKRLKPTNFLVDKLGWRNLFSNVICQDSFAAEGIKKAEALRIALQQYSLDPGEVLMVGDTVEDIKTGKANNVFTAAVLWGYGKSCDLEESGCDFLISSGEVEDFLRKRNVQR